MIMYNLSLVFGRMGSTMSMKVMVDPIFIYVP